MRIPIDRRQATPLYQQIEMYLRQSIVAGTLAPATRLPAARQVAHDLGVSRITVENAYAVLETSGGRGGSVALTYAEALKDAQGIKGNRNEIEGKTVLGVKDVFRPGGGEHRLFQTLWFRTYRYVQVEMETADEPLRIHDLHGIFTAYPFEEKARFESDLPWIKDMWEMNWRVARLCAGETYFDTPYYEQLQYVGDTRIQALISMYLTGNAGGGLGSQRASRNAVRAQTQ